MNKVAIAVLGALTAVPLVVNANGHSPLFSDSQLEAQTAAKYNQLSTTDNIDVEVLVNSDDNVIEVVQNSGGILEGNISDIQLTDNHGSYISVKQNSSAGIRGNSSLIQFKGGDNDAYVVQTGKENAVHFMIEKNHSNDNTFRATQDGTWNDTTVVALGGADGNNVNVEILGGADATDNDTYTKFTNKNADDNTVNIKVSEGDDNRIKTIVAGAGNEIDIDVLDRSDDNSIYVNQTKGDSYASMLLDGSSDYNNVSLTQTQNDASYMKVLSGSDHNSITVVQN
jgi:hypothetical protein